MKEAKIIKKAWEIDCDKLEDGHNCICGVVFCDEETRAQEGLFQSLYMETWYLVDGDIVTADNLPVKRCDYLDVIIFEGKRIPRSEAALLITERERSVKLKAIADNPEIKYCYILKGGYYRPDYKGYSTDKKHAGVYSKEDAIYSAENCDNISVIPINIKEHNKMLEAEINDLKSRLIS